MSLTQARYYTSDALPTTLASPLGTTGNPVVNSLPGTWPAQYPYTVLLDWGLTNQEAISVTGPPTGSGPFTLPCTRAIDGSTGGAGGLVHASGAVAVHGVTAQDFAQPLAFIDGISGFPWQFNPVAYGAKGDGQIVNDGSMTSASATLTTPGVAAPAGTPGVSNAASGGTIAAGTYQVEITYVNQYGETTASSPASTTTTTGLSTVTITSPAVSGNATGWYAYVTQAGGSTFTRQQAAGSPTGLGTNLTLTAPPSSSGATPPGANTTPSNPFTLADVSKAIMVKGAGPAGVTTLVTTITGFTSSGQVTLAAPASTTITGAMVLWATDDTAAFQSAVNAAVSFAQTSAGFQSGPGYCEVFVAPPAGTFYGIAGPLVTGGATLGNAQITLPVIASGGVFGAAPCGNKVTLVIRGGENAAAVRYWNQQVPVTNVTLISFGVFASLSAQNTSITNNGQVAVIGGPTGKNGYGNSTANFSQMMVTVKGLSVLTTHSASGWTYGAMHFAGVANANVFDVAWGTVGTFEGGDFGSVGSFGGGNSIGVFMSQNSNNASCVMRNISCSGGYTYALFATEHTDIAAGLILYCWAGLCPVGSYSGDGGGAGGASVHSVNFTKLDIEACHFHLYVIGSGVGGPVVNGEISYEGSLLLADNNSGVGLGAARGVIRLSGSGAGPTAAALPNPTGLQLINMHTQPGPATAISLSAGVAAQNTYFNWANVVLAGGATVTAVKVGATMGGASAPAMTTIYSQSAAALPPVTVRVPPGGWLQVDGDVPATNSWILD